MLRYMLHSISQFLILNSQFINGSIRLHIHGRRIRRRSLHSRIRQRNICRSHNRSLRFYGTWNNR